MPLWLDEENVRAVLSPAELIDAMESALGAFSDGAVAQPVRTAIEIGDRSFFALMPAFDRQRPVLGAKLVTVVPANAARGLPTHLAAISLFDAESGELLAVMDGRYITEVRTAAASAVSVRQLARPESRVLGILGSGVQARSHLESLSSIHPFAEVRAWSPNPERLAAFARESGGHVIPTASAAGAVRGADIVVVATNSITPAIDAAWVSPGAHVIAIGACRPAQQELDPALVARARLVVDSRAAALQESGDILRPIQEGRFTAGHIHAELGEIVLGRKPGRASADEIRLFKSLGIAIEDVTAAALAYRRARERGLGLEVAL
jgi:ornithine cyclodeaminase/alanine dehydrogenase-like protein (mu-crystallin family)